MRERTGTEKRGELSVFFCKARSENRAVSPKGLTFYDYLHEKSPLPAVLPAGFLSVASDVHSAHTGSKFQASLSFFSNSRQSGDKRSSSS